MRAAASHCWPAVAAEHTQMPDQRVQAALVAGSRDDDISRPLQPAVETHVTLVEADDPGHDRDLPVRHRTHETDIDEGDLVVSQHAFVEAVLRCRQAVCRQVTQVEPAHRGSDRVEHARWQVPEQDT